MNYNFENSKNRRSGFFESRALVLFIALVLIKPAFLSRIDRIGEIYDYLCVVVALVFTLISFRIHISRNLVWIILYYGLVAITTFANGGDISAYIKENIYGYAICIVFSVYIYENYLILLKYINVIQIYFYINLVTLFLYPRGLYKTGIYSQNWFLGYKNPMIRLVIPMLCVSFLNDAVNRGRIRFYNWLFWGIAILTAYKANTTNGMVGVLTFGGVLLLYLIFPQIYKVLNTLSVLCVHFVLMFFMFFVKIPDTFLTAVDYVGKSVSFWGRYRLWEIIAFYVERKPLFGYGYLQGAQFIKISHFRWATHAHNWILNILMMGGIALLFVFLWGVLVSFFSLKKCTNLLVRGIISATLISFFIMGINEAMTNSMFVYPILILAMCSDKLIPENNQMYGLEATNHIE